MELIGHKNIKQRVQIAITAAEHRNQAIPHIMLAGAAGCGKTTTARWLSSIGGYEFFPATPLSLKTKKDVYTLLEKLNHDGYNERGDRIGKITPTILFFDEVHQMPVIGQEILGLAMERFILESDMPNQYIWLPHFTIVGATTDDGKLTKPFRDRFKMNFVFHPYNDGDMYTIGCFHAKNKKMAVTPRAMESIIKRSRGIPRLLVNYLDTMRDNMLAYNIAIITQNVAEKIFGTLGIDMTGLTETEIKILVTLYEAKVAIGLDNLSIVTNESNKTISQSIEPYLIRRGFMIRMSKGRGITAKGIKYLEEAGHLSSVKINKIQIDANYRRL